MITFTIVGHNEADTVTGVIAQARSAARPGDRVLFVDSASTDGSAAVARDAGADVVPGPIGKGAAMTTGLAAVDTEWICFLDADLLAADDNIAARLRDAVTTGDADHYVGDFTDQPEAVVSNTMAIYEPLATALFPEIGGRLGSRPLSGFRALRTAAVPEGLPPDYGVEAYLNIEVALAGRRTAVTPIGTFHGKYKPHPTMGQEIARTVLDRAVVHGRLAPAARPAWEAWVAGSLAVISIDRLPDAEVGAYVGRLRAAAARPVPATGT